MAEPVHPRDLRVSDEEREHVVGLLQRAIGRGMIDLDEFTERTDIAYSATTRGQLNVVLSDLPGLVHRDAPRPGSAGAASSSTPPPPTGDRIDIVSHYSSVSRHGQWVVPGHVVVSNKAGSVKLDFRHAQFTTDVVHIELNAQWGSVQVTLPEGAAADVNALTDVRFSSVDDRSGTSGADGHPRIVFSGRMKGSSLQIRGARHPFFGPNGPLGPYGPLGPNGPLGHRGRSRVNRRRGRWDYR